MLFRRDIEKLPPNAITIQKLVLKSSYMFVKISEHCFLLLSLSEAREHLNICQSEITDKTKKKRTWKKKAPFLPRVHASIGALEELLCRD